MDYSMQTFSRIRTGKPYDKLKIVGVCSSCRIQLKEKLKKRELFPLRRLGDCPLCKVKSAITRCYGEICALCSRMMQQCCVCRAPHNEYGIRSPIRLLSDKRTMKDLRFFKEAKARIYLSAIFDCYQTYLSSNDSEQTLQQLRNHLANLFAQLRVEENNLSSGSGPHAEFRNPFDDDFEEDPDADQLSYAGIR